MTERRAFLIYFALRLAGLLSFGLGVWALSRGEALGAVGVAAGAATLLLRPRHLGLTKR